MDWPVIGLWQWDAQGDLVEIEPLDEAAMFHHMPPVWTFCIDLYMDASGSPSVRAMTH